MSPEQFKHEYGFLLNDVLREMCRFKRDSEYTINNNLIKKLCIKNIKKYKKLSEPTIRYLISIYKKKIYEISNRIKTLQFIDSIIEVQKSVLEEQKNIIKQLNEFDDYLIK